MHIDYVNFLLKRFISLKSLKRPSLTIATGIIILGAVLSLGFIGEFDAFAKKQKSSDTPDWKIWDLHGEHSVLNVHGKKDTHKCNNSNEGKEHYGSSIFVLEYGKSEINFVSNKKSNVDHLQVIDPCAAPFGVDGNDEDPALVQLPTGDQQVYVRILGKPNNGGGGDPSTAKISSPRIIQLCDLAEDDPNAGTRTDCDQIDENDDILPIGLVTNDGGVFGLADDGKTLKRWEDPIPTKGKGKSKAHDITNLFLWTGVVCDETILGTWDLNDDGLLNIADFDNVDPTIDDGVIDPQDLVDLLLVADVGAAESIIVAAETAVPDDASIKSNDNKVIDNVAEFAALIEILFGAEFNCEAFYDEWVFNIADLVLYGLDFDNKGAKLVHFRFYPV